MPATTRSTFSTTVGMVNRIHHNTAHLRTTSEPARTSRFTETDVHMVLVTYDTDRA